MGACFTKTATATTTTEPPPPPQQFNVKSEVQQAQNTNHNDQQVFKKEIFVIKHRISHESDRHTDKDETSSLNPIATAEDGESRNAGGGRVRTSSCSKEEVDAILIQCGRLSRSNSAGGQNPSRKRRYSRSKRSFDFDLNTHLHNDDDVNDNIDNNDGGLNHRHRQSEARVSSPSSRRSSRERDSRLYRCSSKERRISISPSRQSESPFRNSNAATVPSGTSSNRPAKMVSVPATDKSNNVGVEPAVIGSVKRIHVKRNVGSPPARSPAKTNRRIFTDNISHEQTREQTGTMEDEDDRLRYRRKSLVEIDNNAARTLQPGNTKSTMMVPTSVEKLMLRHNITRARRLSRDLDKNPEKETILDPSPPSYASLLLEDIHNFHQKNTNAKTTAPPPDFSLPACVTKACSIMDAVADLNSNTSLFSEDRRRNPTPISKVVDDELERSICNYVTVKQGISAATEERDSSGSNSITAPRETNSTDRLTQDREQDVSPLVEFPRGLLDYPRKGIGRYGCRSTVAST